MTPELMPVPPTIPLFPPPWAEVFGEDRYGVFAEFAIRTVPFVWRWIPPGRFLMGSPNDEAGRFEDEGPQHWVTIRRGSWLMEAPVTQGQWKAVHDSNPSHFKGDELPVEQVDWEASLKFTAELNGLVPNLSAALPTEAEWEYACRAGTTGAFHDGLPCLEPSGKDPALERLGWFDSNSKGATHPIGQKLPNSWGLYDMHGNVWEWCRDGMRTYTAEPESDPVGPMDFRAFRAVRGGSWVDRALYCRAASRIRWGPGGRVRFLGVRLSAGHKPGAAERPVG